MRRAIIGKSKQVELPTATPPTIQARSIAFSSVTSSGMKVGWINGNGNGRLVLISTSPTCNFLEIAAKLGDNDLPAYVSDLSLTSIGSWNDKQGPYTDSSGDISYVIAKASSRTATLSDLPSLTTYYIFILEYNDVAGYSTGYCTVGSTGTNPGSRATL